MKIEHVAIRYRDLEKARDFFEKYFDAKSGKLYCNKTTGFRSYFLSFLGEARLEIMSLPFHDSKEKSGGFHVAFSLGSKEKVDSLTEILRKDGFEILSGPRTTGDGYYETAFLDFEGNHLEITV